MNAGAEPMVEVVAPMPNWILFVLAIGETDDRLVVYEDVGKMSLGI